ncbi:PE family protein [Mycobacterium alsense]|uniref:PE family protein n=1 Tax=Mycobacterium alsense TaxID=324058 RepID=A0AA42BX55_9MYCO|nr:PE family protein [Mycobacterium alsense]
MSFVVTEPELVTVAAENLAGIRSSLGEATAAAAAPTTGVAAAAADEVSAAISQLFGTYGREFQAAAARAAAFHDEFVSLLNGGAAAYLGTEIANAQQGLLNAVTAPARTLGQMSGQIATGSAASLLTPNAAAAFVPGGAYGQLIANTSANLQSLFGAWRADPFPILRQVLVNQLGYWQQIAAALTTTIENFPAVVANLPAAIQAGIQQLLNFPAAYSSSSSSPRRSASPRSSSPTCTPRPPASSPACPLLRTGCRWPGRPSGRATTSARSRTWRRPSRIYW